jgi:GT2 family glycosyltransferase
MLNISIVIYKTRKQQLDRCIESIRKYTKVYKIYLIDNSPINILGPFYIEDKDIEYIYTNKNLGYGKGHNIALKYSLLNQIKYHLVINADVYFSNGVLEFIENYLDKNSNVGQIMPLVRFPDGQIQYLCKLVPTPYDLFFRIIIPSFIRNKYPSTFDLKFTGYTKKMFVPYLSGCFMFLRVSSLQTAGGFDECFFMYPEDIDLTRRIAVNFDTLFLPDVEIFHEHTAASKKSIYMFLIHAFNIFKYFNKWGWFFDKGRVFLNKKTLSQFKLT